MREVLAQLNGGGPPGHIGLAYQTWAPTGSDGKIPEGIRAEWLAEVSEAEVSPDYAAAFERWKTSFARYTDRLFELTLVSRMLVGHGNSSGTDVGIDVHHTWGVPLVPGSALKGLLAHYVDAVYGPDDPALSPWEQPEGQRDRARYLGLTWRGRRIARGPGEVHRTLFGAPDAEEDEAFREHGVPAGATASVVTFHDALYVPGSAPGDKPFSVDVLTVHQKSYYDSSGKTPPNDYDDPNPVSFLTVHPGATLLFAISGPGEWPALAERLLRDALEKWGVGGKTAAGYGRFVSPEEARPSAGAVAGRAGALREEPQLRYQRGQRITVTRVEGVTKRGGPKFSADDGIPGHFAAEDPPQLAVGESIEVWVANTSPQSYTLTLRQPKK